ncbi:hypothetical protein KSS87_023908 [Heliosperma pusillum]|nr:hypothetical protein KSS87_023908 [Heliosperma pusillum]
MLKRTSNTAIRFTFYTRHTQTACQNVGNEITAPTEKTVSLGRLEEKEYIYASNDIKPKVAGAFEVAECPRCAVPNKAAIQVDVSEHLSKVDMYSVWWHGQELLEESKIPTLLKLFGFSVKVMNIEHATLTSSL